MENLMAISKADPGLVGFGEGDTPLPNGERSGRGLPPPQKMF